MCCHKLMEARACCSITIIFAATIVSGFFSDGIMEPPACLNPITLCNDSGRGFL